MDPRIRKTERIFSSRWLNLFESTVRNDGKESKWIFSSRREKPYSQSDKPDAVIIVPLTAVNGETCIILTREFRVPIGVYEIGFPAGLVDPAEDSLTTARRELREETGYALKRVIAISPPQLYSSAGLTDETFQYVVAEAVPAGTARLEPTEDIETLVLTFEEMNALLADNPPISGKAWPFCFLYQQLGGFSDL
jgi:ADP-ribose pyrophosphatase